MKIRRAVFYGACKRPRPALPGKESLPVLLLLLDVVVVASCDLAAAPLQRFPEYSRRLSKY